MWLPRLEIKFTFIQTPGINTLARSHTHAQTKQKSNKTMPIIKCDCMVHYSDGIMSAMASQITSITIVYSIAYSGAHQRKHRRSASLAFMTGIHRWPVNSPHKRPVTRKMVPFDDVVMRRDTAVMGLRSLKWFVWNTGMDNLLHVITCPCPDFITGWVNLHYRKVSNISGTKSPNLIVSRLVFQLYLPNPIKPGVRSRMKM